MAAPAGWLVQALQIAIWPLIKLVALGLAQQVRVELSSRDLRPGEQYVLYANHQSYLDIPMVSASLPMATLPRLLPVRFMLLNSIYDRARWLLRPLGFFPAREHAHDAFGLEAAHTALANHQTVMIFPEGRRSLPSESAPHRGITVLAARSDTRLIPVHIHWRRSGRWRRRYSLVMGRPFNGAGMAPSELMERVYQLA
jgi:1-acyl-sn-glycerol-3-phosphate acyltransferase